MRASAQAWRPPAAIGDGERVEPEERPHARVSLGFAVIHHGRRQDCPEDEHGQEGQREVGRWRPVCILNRCQVQAAP